MLWISISTRSTGMLTRHRRRKTDVISEIGTSGSPYILGVERIPERKHDTIDRLFRQIRMRPVLGIQKRCLHLIDGGSLGHERFSLAQLGAPGWCFGSEDSKAGRAMRRSKIAVTVGNC